MAHVFYINSPAKTVHISLICSLQLYIAVRLVTNLYCFNIKTSEKQRLVFVYVTGQNWMPVLSSYISLSRRIMIYKDRKRTQPWLLAVAKRWEWDNRSCSRNSVPKTSWRSCSVAAPAQSRSQVISRSENPPARSPGCTFFHKKLTTFLVVALKTQAANAVSPSA